MGKAMLIVVLGMTFVAGKTLTGLNSRSVPLNQSTAEYYEGLLSRTIATSGANIAISRLFQDPNWNAGLAPTDFSGGQYRATVSSSNGVVTIVATGTYGKTQKTIEVKLVRVNGWPYVVFADHDIHFGGNGTITGDIHANGWIHNDESWTVNGTATDSPTYVDLPTINWTFYRNQALAAGRFVNGSLTFTAAGSPYSGLWYATGDVYIQAGAVIRGAIITETNCRFKGNNLSITATPSNYPAIVAGHDVTDNGSNVEVRGLVYAGHDFKPGGNNIAVIGAILAGPGHDAHGGGSNKTIIYDAKYVNNLTGITYSASNGSSGLQMVGWVER